MSSYFYRVIPNFGEKLPDPHVCQHQWRQVKHDPQRGDAYCDKCRHYGSLSEDERNRPLDWWKERQDREKAMYPDKELRDLE